MLVTVNDPILAAPPELLPIWPRTTLPTPELSANVFAPCTSPPVKSIKAPEVVIVTASSKSTFVALLKSTDPDAVTDPYRSTSPVLATVTLFTGVASPISPRSTAPDPALISKAYPPSIVSVFSVPRATRLSVVVIVTSPARLMSSTSLFVSRSTAPVVVMSPPNVIVPFALPPDSSAVLTVRLVKDVVLPSVPNCTAPPAALSLLVSITSA